MTQTKIRKKQIEDIVVSDISDLTVSATELNYVDGVTSNIQTQLGAKPTISEGAGAPATTPDKEGDIYIDTTDDNAYVAVGTASSADWVQIDGGGGGGTPGGADTQIQYNDDGAFAGDTNLGYVQASGRIKHLAQDGTGTSFRSVFLGATSGNANGSYSVTIAGYRQDATNVASGSASIAIGANSKAMGNNTVAIGGGYGATGGAQSISTAAANAVVIGSGASVAYQANTIAIGYNAKVTDYAGIAIGDGSEVTESHGIAFGRNTKANFAHSVGIGYQANTTKVGQMRLGKARNGTAKIYYNQTLVVPLHHTQIGYTLSGDELVPLTEESSAVLSVQAPDKGFLPPLHTDATRDAISSPATGLMVYNTTTNLINVYNGTEWRQLTDAAV